MKAKLQSVVLLLDSVIMPSLSDVVHNEGKILNNDNIFIKKKLECKKLQRTPHK